jgi:hypothetical protein
MVLSFSGPEGEGFVLTCDGVSVPEGEIVRLARGQGKRDGDGIFEDVVCFYEKNIYTCSLVSEKDF